MTHPLLLDKIRKLEEELLTLDRAKAITHPIYVSLNNCLFAIKQEYITLHKDELIAAKKGNSDTLPFLAKTANVLLTLRTALPVNGEANLLQTEEALAAAILVVADEVKALFNQKQSTHA